MSKNSTKDVARGVIEEVAPDEAGLFDQLWAEASRNPDLLAAEPGSSDRHLGVGIGILDSSSLMSLVVIPVVIAVVKEAAGKSFNTIVEYIKERLRKSSVNSGISLSDADIDRVADAVARKMTAKTQA